MNDITQRLLIDNRLVKEQAVSKLVSLIKSHCKSHSGVDVSSQSPQMLIFWQTLAGNDLISGTACANTVCDWINTGEVDCQQLLSKLLSLASVAQNLTAIVKIVTKLLTLTVQANAGCPFSISRPAHPFISLLVSRHDTWYLLREQIVDLLNSTSEKLFHKTLSMLDPFFKYVFLEPSHSSENGSLRYSLLSLHSEMVSGSTKHLQLLQYLLDIICLIRIESGDNASETCIMLLAIGRSLLLIIDSSSPELDSIVSTFAQHSLSVAVQLMCQQVDVCQLLSIVSQVIDKHVNLLNTHFVLLHCVELLFFAPSNHLAMCLNLVSKALSTRNNPLIVSMLLLPLLQLHSLSVASLSASEKSKITELVEIVVRTDFCVDVKQSAKDLSKLPSVRSYTYRMYETMAITVYNDFQHGAVEEWLKRVEISLSLLCTSTRLLPIHLTCLVSAVFAQCQKLTSVKRCIAVLHQIVMKDSTQSLYMLPLIMFKLKTCHNPETLSFILKSSPSLAIHKMSVGPLMVACKSLASSQQMTSVCLRVMSLLWQRHDECFPYLIQMVSSAAGLLDVDKDECLIARAACLEDVCSLRPHQHGSDMLPLVSAILSDCCQDKQSTAVCLALRALNHLCDAEVIDLRTSWTAIATKLCYDKRPSVLVSLCRLSSTVLLHTVDTKEYQVFVDDVVNWLWKSTQHLNSKVADAAFEALSKFPSSLFSIHHFPSAITDDIVQNSDTDDVEDQFKDGIPGFLFTRLLHTLHLDVLAGYTILLASLVKAEVTNLPRGMSFSANRSVDIHNIDSEELIQRRLAHIPVNYHYLLKTSVLRALLDVLLEASNQGLKCCNTNLVKSILQCLIFEKSYALPPLQWNVLFSPLMQRYPDVDIQVLCLTVAIQQSEYQTAAMLFVSSYIKQASSLPVESQMVVFKSLKMLSQTIPLVILTEYIETGFLEPFRQTFHITEGELQSESEVSCQQQDLCETALKGYGEALEYSVDNNKSAYELLSKSLEKICNFLPLRLNNVWRLIAQCLHHIPEDDTFYLLSDVIRQRDNLLYFHLSCHLLACGHQPLRMINSVIESFVPEAEKRTASFCIWRLIQVLSETVISSSVSSCLSWLLELMGHIKDIASQRVTVIGSTASVTDVLRYFMLVYSSAILSWSPRTPATVLFGLSSSESLSVHFPFEDHIIFHRMVMDLMPEALCTLHADEPWLQLTHKTIDFLLNIHDAPVVAEDSVLKNFIKRCLYGFRHSTEFKRTHVWSRVCMI